MTVQDFIDAYEQTELQPLQGAWIKYNYACPITTILIAKYGRSEAIKYLAELPYEELKIKLSIETGINIVSFLEGWEGVIGKGKSKSYLLGKELREHYADCRRAY
jgi:hypothetical protein